MEHLVPMGPTGKMLTAAINQTSQIMICMEPMAAMVDAEATVEVAVMAEASGFITMPFQT